MRVWIEVGRGRVTPDETIEQIKATYAMNGSLAETAKVLSVPKTTVAKYTTQAEVDQFEQVRTQKRPDIINAIGDAKIKLLKAMVDDDHLAKASLQELAVAFGILQDKELLLTGQATSRTETISSEPLDRLSVDDIEQLERLRDKLVTDGALT